MKLHKILPVSLAVTSFLLGAFATEAEARRGARGAGRRSADVDLDYQFSIFDTTPSEAEIESCATGSNSCLFRDAVSELTIDKLNYLTTGTLDSLTIGTPALSLLEQDYNPGLGSEDFNSLISNLSFASESLSLLSNWNGSTLSYTITDDTGNPLQAIASFSDRDPVQDPTLTRTFGAFSISSNGARPDDRLINSAAYIVDFLRGEEPLAAGFAFVPEASLVGDESVEDFAFTSVDTLPEGDNPATEVPEPASVIGLLTLSLLSVTSLKRVNPQ